MKKTIIQLCLLFCLLFSFGVAQETFAADTIKLTTTEKVPGANCEPITNTRTEPGDNGTTATVWEDSGTYDCEVELGWTSVMIMLGKMIRFFTTVAIIGAVLFIVISGIQLSMGGLDGGAKEAAKKRVFQLLGGVVLLLLSGPLLTLIAPWVYR